jgi:hypothetical protein
MMADTCQSRDLARPRAFAGMGLLTLALVLAPLQWPDGNLYFSVALLLAWGGFCSANALRCGRLHCYVTGPVCLLGALVLVLMSLGVLSLSSQVFSGAILGAILLGFAAEAAFGRYGPRRA